MARQITAFKPTDREEQFCRDIAARVDRMRDYLNSHRLAQPPEPTDWHAFLSAYRRIQGNLSNDGSFIATLLAKQYLTSRFTIAFDAAEKAQGAPGIDIDVTSLDGQRIVAEIKTTVPYQGTDFGAQQAASFKKDFAKLAGASAAHKYLFVTDPAAFLALQKPKYTKLMPGVRIVDLGTDTEHLA